MKDNSLTSASGFIEHQPINPLAREGMILVTPEILHAMVAELKQQADETIADGVYTRNSGNIVRPNI